MKLFLCLLFVSIAVDSVCGQDSESSASYSYQMDSESLARAVPSRSNNNRVSSNPMQSVSTIDQTLALYPNAFDASWYSGSLLRMHYLISQLRSPILPYAYLAAVQLQRWLLAQLVQLTREQLLPRMTQFSAGLLSRNCEMLSNQVLDHVRTILQTLQPDAQTPQHRSPDN